MIVALIPAALIWVITGPPFGSRVPGPDILMLPPTRYVALACYCLGNLVFVALEYVSFLRRPRTVEGQ
ncbi:MAG: hypothetical protein M3680_04620 [Myxococcota bacterium]|nr:hypothetical protein [Myxococcota bacterium]